MVLRACALVWWWRAQLLSAGTVDCCRRARVSEPVSYPPSPEHTPSTGSNPVTRGGRDGKVRCVMEVLHPRCAGIDVSKKDAKVCVRIQGSTRGKTSSTVTTWGSMTNQILALKDHL